MSTKRTLMVKTVKHDGQVFHASEVRILSDELRGYFIHNGWAVDADTPDAKPATPSTADVTLQVNKSSHTGRATTL